MQIHQYAPQSDNSAAFAIPGSAVRASHHCFAQEPVRPNPMLVSSIAETAGLSRFVYLVGKSEHRYVFSAISKGQMSLYCDAVFAIVEGDDERLWVGNYSMLIRFLNDRAQKERPRIFVHLLADGVTAKSHVISDLTRTVGN